MKESQCLLHLQRLFWTPFCLYFSARRPREILAAVRARASRDDTICSKNRNFDPYHRDKARSRAYGLLPLWLLVLLMRASSVQARKVRYVSKRNFYCREYIFLCLEIFHFLVSKSAVRYSVLNLSCTYMGNRIRL